MKELSLQSSETIVIEDSKTGLLSGLESKATVIGLATSLSTKEITNISDKILPFNNYEEIGRFFKKHV